MHLLVIVAVAACLMRNVGPLLDYDVYWHVPLGHEILHLHSVAGAGLHWSIAPVQLHWVSSQWLAEVCLALVQSWLGWKGLILLRLVLAAVVLVAYGRLVLPLAPGRTGALLFAAVVVPMTSAFQERPQMASFVLLVWLARHAMDLLTGKPGPRTWVVFAVTVLWANLHGLWVMAPFAFGLVALCRFLDDPRDPGQARQPLILAVISTVAGCLTPVGPRGLLLPITLRSATHHIAEWQPTELTIWYTLGVSVLLVTAVVAWSRARPVAPRSELVYVLAIFAFAQLAFRNVLPASILMGPVITRRAALTWPLHRQPTTPTERRVLGALATVVVVVAAAYIGLKYAVTDTFPKWAPRHVAATLAAEPGEKRVLTDYNTSGFLIAFAGPGSKVAIDGRADRYGGPYITRYLQMTSMGQGWETLFDEIAPTHAVLAPERPLTGELLRRGWHVVARDSDYELLEP